MANSARGPAVNLTPQLSRTQGGGEYGHASTQAFSRAILLAPGTGTQVSVRSVLKNALAVYPVGGKYATFSLTRPTLGLGLHVPMTMTT